MTQFLASCHIESGPSWDAVYREILQNRKSETRTPDPTAVRLLREAVLSFESSKCLKDLADRIGLSGPEATRCSKVLEQCRYAQRHSASIGQLHLLFLGPTPEGFDLVGMPRPVGFGRGGPAHRHCLSRVEGHFQAQGYSTTREIEVQGKRIDMVATKARERVFAEIEMTPENAARNASADLAVAGADVKQILVVCPTDAVLRRVEASVGAAVDAQAIRRFAFRTVSNL